MGLTFWLANIFGGLGIIFNALIMQQKSREKVLTFKLISDFLWGMQYLLMGAYSGLAIACIGIIRETIFLNQKRKWAQSKLWLLLFILLSLISPIITWKNFSSLLPMTASIISVICFWIGNPLLTKILAFPISACQFTYGVVWHLPTPIINEILAVISSIIGCVRYYREHKSK